MNWFVLWLKLFEHCRLTCCSFAGKNRSKEEALKSLDVFQINLLSRKISILFLFLCINTILRAELFPFINSLYQYYSFHQIHIYRHIIISFLICFCFIQSFYFFKCFLCACRLNLNSFRLQTPCAVSKIHFIHLHIHLILLSIEI